MTIKKRSKLCSECNVKFFEKKGDSNKQWEARMFCSMKCNNSGKHRFTDIFERLERYQIKNEHGCWLWSGSKDGGGYGTLSNRGGGGFSPEKAHRVSYEYCHGKIPDGINICHTCDNPPCTNPDHLFKGTQKENMEDCSKKGRLNKKSVDNLIPGKEHHIGSGVTKNKVKRKKKNE